MSKEQIIEELKRRGIETEEQTKLDELRKTLRKDCKKEEQGAGEVNEQTKKAKEIKMEYTAKLDFKMGTDDWEEFMERIELYYEANDIENEEKKRAILLTQIDAETYSIVRKVCAPQKPKETSLKDIITKMEKYIQPKENETVLRQQFRERKQKKEESVIQYIADLRNLAQKCKFKEEEEAIRY